jgi:uroporphyrinogen III methyltransferase/synthase
VSGVGRVVLVGAGPGDPDLITLRGAEALRRADVVVYDALASPELLALAPESAERIDVGKRGHEEPRFGQAEICELLVERARAGRSVVRLKGGDPYVFGRGAEEASACARAGIPCEVIPGVSAVVGALAYAGVPLTDRRYSASFAVVTGHKDPTKVSAETRWELLARAADTLVVLMGMKNLAEVAERARAGGLAASTPAAVIENGTLPEQRVVEAPLGEIAAAAAAAGLRAPAVLVIGEVLRLRAELAWYERQALFGRQVLVMRAREQSGALLDALRRAGSRAIQLPLIQIEASRDPAECAALDAAIASLARYDALLVTSANGIRGLQRRAESLGIELAGGLRAWCVGEASADAARAAGFAVEPLPDRSDADALARSIASSGDLGSCRFLFARARDARDVLARELRAAGAQVDEVVAYVNAAVEVDSAALRADLAAGRIDAIAFTSPSTARRFDAMLDADAREFARRCAIAAIGRVTADALVEIGLKPDAVAEDPSAEALVRALERAALAKPRSRESSARAEG